MSSGEFIPLLYGIVSGEAFLLGEATDTQLEQFASLACRETCCLECLGAKQAADY